jgi:(R,R)-butanediol dehydrogenase/meso-butanediol dehydrogenase/diacetyl reductase
VKAGLVTGLRRFELVDVPEPEARPGTAVAEIALCGICGTDVHGFLSSDPYNPAICGHEWVGTTVPTHSCPPR